MTRLVFCRKYKQELPGLAFNDKRKPTFEGR